MWNLPKLKSNVYIVVCASAGSINILKGVVTGVRRIPSSIGEWLFSIETCNGTYERFHTEIWESVEEIKNDLEKFVVE